MYVAIVHEWGTVRSRSALRSHNEPYVSKHRCVWTVDICALKWGEKEHKSSSEMGPLEMQDRLNAAALINTIVISLMMYHGTESVVMNPVVSPPCLQHAAFHLGSGGEESPARIHPIVILLKRVVRGPLFHPTIISICFTVQLYFISAIWCMRMKELLGNACSDGSDETDVLGNYQICAGKRKNGYQMTHGHSPATPTESIHVFCTSVPRLLQLRNL